MENHEKDLQKAIKKLQNTREGNKLNDTREIQDGISYVIKDSKYQKTIEVDHSFNNIYISFNNNFYCCKEPPPIPTIMLTSQKYFSKVSNGTILGSDLIISVNSFVDDDGTPIEAFPKLYQYFNLYINGVIQQNGVGSVDPFQLTIKNGSILDKDDPISLEFVMTNTL
ncbi:DUF4183 domain-containing protein [Pullulanibacillus sp. KACC 23026]|uniref:DUF4183 domain-containing protein n=1 Tax=Pullulanibacillus sp. KACC 23026 TaxID=3028315 RepID=UPI0023B03132|nr:DUF4183 domain-containing protein [Pullulanibacillus sp. KACC 23026]WEG11534.1 DUF4183 domain-containing protein [Pullulanibacillus sp. KACC 23026]